MLIALVSEPHPPGWPLVYSYLYGLDKPFNFLKSQFCKDKRGKNKTCTLARITNILFNKP